MVNTPRYDNTKQLLSEDAAQLPGIRHCPQWIDADILVRILTKHYPYDVPCEPYDLAQTFPKELRYLVKEWYINYWEKLTVSKTKIWTELGRYMS